MEDGRLELTLLQVRYSFTPNSGPHLRTPQKYTACIQELASGAWAFPVTPAPPAAAPEADESAEPPEKPLEFVIARPVPALD